MRRPGKAFCINCGVPFDLDRARNLKSPAAFYCSDKCRVLAYTNTKSPNGCWEWLGATFVGNGYGQVTHGDVPTKLAHRFSYIAFNGPVPPDLVLDHLCRNRRCVNPAHLEPVTPQVNVIRGNVGVAQRAKTHCIRGHEFTGYNLIKKDNGTRRCRECHNSNQRERNKHKGNQNEYRCEIVAP